MVVHAVALVLLTGAFLLVGSSPAAEKLNVLFIAVDDLRPELTCYGVDEMVTPNFDRLAASGICFDRAYCQQAVCGASRLSIMGGLYPLRTREQTYHVRQWRQRHPDLVTMNRHFRDHGFRTIGLGKIYHERVGEGADESGWDEWIRVSESMYADPKNLESKRGFSVHRPETRLGSFTEALDVPDEQYADGRRAAKTVERLRELSTTEERFFLAVGFLKPHLPFVAPKRYWDLYEREAFSMPTNLGSPPGYPEYAANLTGWELKFYEGYEGETPADFSDELNRRLLHGYAACVSYIDACLGRILDVLEKTGLAQNTIVVLWGDHGYRLGEHSSWTKHTNFEVDVRVPLFVRVPGKVAGETSNSLIELIDLYPTLCELTGIPIPSHCEGKSFAAVVEEPGTKHRQSAYSAYPAEEGVMEKAASGMIEGPPSETPAMGMGHSLRFGNYRYSEWRAPRGQEVTAAVLTDLAVDPGE
ncbi:MAG: sulfatase, partial [Verrucomicrobiota bacterium]